MIAIVFRFRSVEFTVHSRFNSIGEYKANLKCVELENYFQFYGERQRPAYGDPKHLWKTVTPLPLAGEADRVDTLVGYVCNNR
jgi:hypothetical protein